MVGANNPAVSGVGAGKTVRMDSGVVVYSVCMAAISVYHDIIVGGIGLYNGAGYSTSYATFWVGKGREWGKKGGGGQGTGMSAPTALISAHDAVPT